jgi:hypothetical protein
VQWHGLLSPTLDVELSDWTEVVPAPVFPDYPTIDGLATDVSETLVMRVHGRVSGFCDGVGDLLT